VMMIRIHVRRVKRSGPIPYAGSAIGGIASAGGVLFFRLLLDMI
jgi:hypothetical protein